MNLDNIFSPLDTNGNLRPELVELLDLFGVDCTLPLDKLVEIVAGMWITKGHERWQEPEVVLDTNAARASFWLLTGALGLQQEVWPTITEFDHVLFLGGGLRPQDRKNEFGVRLWNSGVRFDNIAHLGGDRKLSDEQDSLGLFYQQLPGGLPIDPEWKGLSYSRLPATEADMLSELWQRSLVPADMRAVPTIHVGANATTGFRANTGDTFNRWLAAEPKFNTVLVVSINPHAPFQYWDAVRKLRPNGFDIHVAAPGAALGPQRMNYFTGAIARWLRSYARATGRVAG